MDKKTALVSAFLYAIFFPYALHAAMFSYDSYMTFMVALCLWLFYKTLETKKTVYLLLCGLSAGIGAYFRETIYLVVALIIVNWLLLFPLREAIYKSFLFVSIFLLCLLPFCVWNFKHHGRFYFTFPFQGFALLDTIVEQDKENRWGFRDKEGNFDGVHQMARRLGGPDRELFSVENNQMLLDIALPIVKSAPLWYFKGYIKKVFQNTLNPWSMWHILAPEPHWIQYKAAGGTYLGFIRHHPMPFFMRLFGKISELFLFLFTLLGLYRLRARWRDFFAMAVLPFAFIFSLCVFNAMPRMILPGKLPFFLFASFAIVNFFKPTGQKD